MRELPIGWALTWGAPWKTKTFSDKGKVLSSHPAYKCFRCSPASSIQSSQHRSICNNHLNNHLHPQALCALLCWRNNTLILLLQFCRFFFVSALTTCCIGQLLKLAVARQPLVWHILLSWCDHGRTKYSRGRFDFMCVHVLVFGSWGVWWERMLCVCVCVGNCYVLKFWVLVDPICCWEALYGTIIAEGTDCPPTLTADRFFGVVASCNLNNLTTASILLVVSLGCRLMFL